MIEAEIIKSVIVLNAAISAGRYIPYGVSINAIRCAEGDKVGRTGGAAQALLESNELCFDSSGVSQGLRDGVKILGVQLSSAFVFVVTLVALVVF